MRDRMRVRPDGWPSADDAPTGPIPRIAVPTELPRPQQAVSATGNPQRSQAGLAEAIGDRRIGPPGEGPHLNQP